MCRSKLHQILFTLLLITILTLFPTPMNWTGAALDSELANSPSKHHATATTQTASEGLRSDATANSEPIVPLYDDLGNHHHAISTGNALTQRYFDQGLILSYGFNHAEALRAFQQAADLDPTCAMCYWGMAYVLGPNINAVMEEGAVPTAWQAIQHAMQLSDSASQQEQAYIQALAQRYAPEPVAERSPLNLAYANAMREVVRQYPTDPDAVTLFAEALMDTTPWDYWQKT